VLECAAVLFDLDGVLVDSTRCIERIWRRWAARHELDAARVLAAAHGRRTTETIALVAPHLDMASEVAKLKTDEMSDIEGVDCVPTAASLVGKIPDGRWAVVTSGARAVAEFRLRLAGVAIPAVMISGDDVAHGKPDPEGYLAAAHRLGVPAGECVVIEDAPVGVTAAHEAGMRAIAVATSYPAAELASADIVVDSLSAMSVQLRDGRLLLTISRRRA
jgi:mannitol-1-/sugar-/sorbitol-6-phosphatase